ncbi:hypothetical protein B0H19DRAFT_1284387 [Mycena capillaripes]|nr:hypothetical protein B0H19DRAFT_1284387 [Mycena capillaripes]
MRPTVTATLCLAISLSCVQAAQIPFENTPVQTWVADSRWENLGAQPDSNATGHLLFETVNSLLQRWPNTQYRNGHTVIPGSVPVGTLLYHGRGDSILPTIPEWTALNPEFSYIFCKNSADEALTGCWQLTLVTTRPLKVLYFDGSSAVKMDNGPLDLQDLLVWGKVDPTRRDDERARIQGLCAWGKEFGIDGYVREIMVCDFEDGVKLLSVDFIAALAKDVTYIKTRDWLQTLSLPPKTISPASLHNDTRRMLVSFEVLRAGMWHNRYPGETRIALDLTRLVSFYDTALAPSLIPLRAGKERWDHRLQGISAADLAAVTTHLRAALAAGPDDVGSGVNWRTLYHVLVDRYADRLELLEYLLNTMTTANMDDRAKTVQMQLRLILAPYILYSANPVLSRGKVDDAWAAPIWGGCATRHTAHIHTDASLQMRLTSSERVLLSGLDETNREICRVVVRMWVEGVRAGLDALIPRADKDFPNKEFAPEDISRVVEGWRADMRALIAWLDWSVWVKCRPACASEELCYLDSWPLFLMFPNTDHPEDWKRPQPRCVRRLEPYTGF